MTPWPIKNVHQMRVDGWTRDSLRRAVQGGTLWRIRQGYYSEPMAPHPMVRAVRVGGVVTAASALPYRNIWTPPDERLHVLLRRNASRLSDPDHRFEAFLREPLVHPHWTSVRAVRANALAYEPVDDAVSALTGLAACAPVEFVVAAIDSALNRRVVLRQQIAEAARVHPKLAEAVALCDERAQAGGESVVRVRLRMRGVRVRVQVRIDGVGRVDLLIEDRLVIEIDGREFHAVADQFAEDRRRDRELALRGYDRLRLTYAQIFFDWPTTERTILAMLSRAA